MKRKESRHSLAWGRPSATQRRRKCHTGEGRAESRAETKEYLSVVEGDGLGVRVRLTRVIDEARRAAFPGRIHDLVEH